MGLFGGGGGGGIGNALGGGAAGSVLGSVAMGPAGAAILGYNGLKQGWSGAGGLAGTIFGNGEDPGLLGVGKYEPSEQYHVQEGAFNNNQSLQSRQADFAAQLQAANARSAPMVGTATINNTDAGAARGQQMALADALWAQTQGKGPSLAQMQLKQATDRNLAQAIAAQASAGGSGGGLAMRQIQQNQIAAGQGAARDSAMLRAQEQLNAQNQFGSLVSGMRGQDLSLATNQAQLDQDAGKANQAARLTQMGLNDAQARFYNQGQMQLDLEQQKNLQELEKLKANQNAAFEQSRANAYSNAATARGNLAGGIGGGLMAAVASDENLKTDIESGAPALKELLREIKPHKYRYKNSKFGEGNFVSPMAQELERTELGKSMVENTPEGKMVNYQRASGVMLAAASMLSDRLDSLEEAFKSRRARK